MITTTGLTKRYGSVTAVDELNLDVRQGDIYGFLGANGSGKTTTVRMLLGLVLATKGEIALFDKPMPASSTSVLPRIGALVEGPAFYGHLSGAVNLALYDAAGPSGSRRDRSARIHRVLLKVGLDGVGKRPVKAYSLGMRQRLGLGAALLGEPDLLILDEPTNGLDPQGIQEVRALLLDLNRRGTTIFLSSHLLAEVEQLCTRVGVIDRGHLVIQDELAHLLRPTGRTVVHSPDVEHAMALLGAQVIGRRGQALVVDDADTAAVNARLVAGGVRVVEIAPERHSLEEIVLALTSAGEDRVAAE